MGVLIILIPLLLFSLNAYSTIFSMEFYEKEFVKHNVYEDVEEAKVIEITSQVLGYLKDDQELTTDLLNDKEKMHMKDVKDLFKKFNFTMYLSFFLFIAGIIALALMKGADKLPTVGIVGGVITLILVGLIALIASLGFTVAFEQFHEYAFENELWKLDANEDNLIKVYGEGFFYDMVKRILAWTGIWACIIIIISLSVMRILKEKTYKQKKVNLSSGGIQNG